MSDLYVGYNTINIVFTTPNSPIRDILEADINAFVCSNFKLSLKPIPL